MASTVARGLPEVKLPTGHGVSLWRLHVLRATYLLIVVGLGVTIMPELFDHEPTARGVIPGVLSGLWALAFLGLRYPLQMLPLLFFEFAWKTAWLLKYGLPQWSSGEVPPTWAGDFPAILFGVILMPLVIPWGHAWRRFVTGPADAVADGASKIRLHVIRTVYVLMIILGTYIIGRILLTPPAMERGVFASMLIALFVLSLLVIRNPLKMLPILLLECVWKAIWLVSFGLPQWMAGIGSPKLDEDIWAVGLGPIFFGLLIPWGYVWQHYVAKPAERWR
jgi:hypothetical protein